jgi:hypothetical protein
MRIETASRSQVFRGGYAIVETTHLGDKALISSRGAGDLAHLSQLRFIAGRSDLFELYPLIDS